MNRNKQPHALVAVLDWGLGHATRCIPIIRGLLKRQCKVTLAGNGPSLQLLKEEFPELNYVELPGYNIRYSSSGWFFISLFFQLPKILKAIVIEHSLISKKLKGLGIDFVISDNRYGCYNQNIYSVLISHQLNLQLPLILSWCKPSINFLLRLRIKKFNELWIPDLPDSTLSGELSKTNFESCNYVGVLSRFISGVETDRKDIDYLAIISGPEPQRSLLEKLVIDEFLKTKLLCVIIQGSPHHNASSIQNQNITIINHLPSHTLESLICRSSCIISRSGYSTIMDFAKLKVRNMVFVPTPGQTEQEYLAMRLKNKGIAFFQTQDEFNLQQALIEIKNYSGFKESIDDHNLLQNSIQNLLARFP